LIEKYFNPIYGITYLWFSFFRGRMPCYVNYLPLWNTLLYVLLPPTTILGPITGGRALSSSNTLGLLIRKYFFPILYKLNLIILSYRNKYLLFSTDILAEYISKKDEKFAIFNFNFSSFTPIKKLRKKKKIDLILYYRKHPTKKIFLLNDIVKKLLKLSLNIHVVGDKLEIDGIKNHGYVIRKRMFDLLLNSKFTIASGENFHSIFVLDSISSNVKVFFDKKNIPKNFILERKNFIKINFNDPTKSYYIIKKNIKTNSMFVKNRLGNLIRLEKKFIKYFNMFDT